ncbi:MAG TPA: DUF4197 domain-containing protein [Methylophaga sp.]|jgi:hypothetical protein|uniref:DUF4197 domain-containing protein n=1 Tax=unclassified Methylophaga TaxID=2629249 RepID=UPI000C90E9C7|nr:MULTISPECIES: DUF4197 domain-containing protein [unclassified Methylophaga]MAP28220.1 hypothetical protein [Methylophaga sp.]HAD32779.1 DUF4197 domain-containing protein [Methylophaga sp.]HBX61233.1 DUF4197 domain-containing protein [Methylophaga sp.]HCO00876.1 DUF4197 domain-containing protein [Methylophaga sp.]|tara:strand:- start:12770 stop:13519 length:750 start_codon:yes stop_codon:yes gene_type:complete
MKFSVMVTSALFIFFLMATSPSHADWKKFLEDFSKSGTTALGTSEGTDLSSDTIANGLKEALEVGTRKAVENVSKEGGYLNNPKIHIPLPPRVQQAAGLMRQLGLNKMADDFEQSINRAAEKAAPQATSIMIDAIKSMTIDDARNILNGENDAATRFFEDRTRGKLADLFEPVIDTSLNEVGATRYYNQLNDKLSSVPVVGQELDMDLQDYVTDQALNGLFVMLAEEEQKIRDNPAARTSEILQQVFGK